MSAESYERDGIFAAVASHRLRFADLVATIRRHAKSRFTPPVVGPRAPLADVLIHTGDVARPLGGPHGTDPETVVLALDFVTGAPPSGSRRRSAWPGCRWWPPTSTGSGGPARS